MNKIKIVFKTGEVLRFYGCGVQLDNADLTIICGKYVFIYEVSEIKNFYVKGLLEYEKEIKV